MLSFSLFDFLYVLSSHASFRGLTYTIHVHFQIVANMADMAASGGYYISCVADRIVAPPGCITGSIGVISGKLVTRAFWEKRVGVTWDDVRTNENTKLFSSLYDLDEEGQKICEFKLVGELSPMF